MDNPNQQELTGPLRLASRGARTVLVGAVVSLVNREDLAEWTTGAKL